MRPEYIPGGRMSGNGSGMIMGQGGPMPPPLQQQGGNQFPGYMGVQQLQASQQAQGAQQQNTQQQMANYSRMQPGMMNIGTPQNFQRGGYNINQHQQMQIAPGLANGMNIAGSGSLQNGMGPGASAMVNASSPNSRTSLQMGGGGPHENKRLVYLWNLDEQMSTLRGLVSSGYNYVSLDVKFPGIVARPIGLFKSTTEYHYQTLRTNVDTLQVVQIGMSFADEYGNKPLNNSTWQFNFKFNINEDMCSSDGIEVLKQAGVQFDIYEVEGIDVFAFGELLISSGLVLDENINWITYHSGYDLGYLLSVMLNDKLPVEESGFLNALKLYFPTVWDVKQIVKTFNASAKLNLGEIAEELNIRGPLVSNSGMNSSGDEAILNSTVFFELRRVIPEISKAKGALFGLGDVETNTEAKSAAAAAAAAAAAEVDKKVTASATNAFQYGKMGSV